MLYTFDITVSKVAITALVKSTYIKDRLFHQWLQMEPFQSDCRPESIAREFCTSYMIIHYHLFQISEYMLDVSKRHKYNMVNNSFGHDICSSDVLMYIKPDTK